MTLECLASSQERGQAQAAANQAVRQAQEEAEALRKNGATPKKCPINEFLNEQHMDYMRQFHKRLRQQ